jgi:type I restriction enzyme S subunit
LLVPIPSPEEQAQIANILEACDQKVILEEVRKQAMDTLFQSLLNHLMTGKVRAMPIDNQYNLSEHAKHGSKS